MKDISSIKGKEFVSPITKISYGIHEAFSGPLPEGLSAEIFGQPFAWDGCGNLFTENDKKEICFWDHETDELLVIAETWDAFHSGCVEPKSVELEEGQVISAWIDPEFARQLGIDVPSKEQKKEKPDK